jgi:hypothetical protein
MKKSTKISDGFYLNLKQIVTFEVVGEDQLVIATNAHPDTLSSKLVIAHSLEADAVLGRSEEGIVYVEIEELQRIKKDISKFLGIKKIKQEETAE